ncbi:cell division protein FtsL, partial [Francisella tularensis subsp. holarctica]|nr:cell division protein FtsL [Francisella tularensis subsp. holarctica]
MMLTNRQIRVRLFESLKHSLFKQTVGTSFALLFILLITAF